MLEPVANLVAEEEIGAFGDENAFCCNGLEILNAKTGTKCQFSVVEELLLEP